MKKKSTQSPKYWSVLSPRKRPPLVNSVKLISTSRVINNNKPRLATQLKVKVSAKDTGIFVSYLAIVYI